MGQLGHVSHNSHNELDGRVSFSTEYSFTEWTAENK